MLDGPPAGEATARARKGGSGLGLEIIVKLATVLEVEPAEFWSGRQCGLQSPMLIAGLQRATEVPSGEAPRAIGVNCSAR